MALNISGEQSAPVTPRHEARSMSLPVLLWVVISTCIGIAGFIMAAWATHMVHDLAARTYELAQVVVVSSPNNVPIGYSVAANLYRGTGYWAPRPDMLEFRSDFGIVAYEGEIYIMGGLSNDNTTGNATVLNQVTKYDVIYNNVAALAPMPEPRTRFAAQAVNVSGGGNIYVFGGFSNPDPANGMLRSNVLAYNVTAATWSSLTNSAGLLLARPRTDACAAAVNGKIYITGGYDSNGNTQATVEEFDPVAQTITVLPVQLSVPRGDCFAVSINDTIYALGGSTQIQPLGVDCSQEYFKCYSFSKVVETFTPTSTVTTRVADMLFARGDFGCTVTAYGNILVAGGETSDTSIGVFRLLAQPWVEIYNPADDYWTPKAPLPEARFRFGMALAYDNSVYAFGGYPSCPILNQDNETLCRANGLKGVVAYDDVPYPEAFLLKRN
eukprot:CAMPEP_0119103698 /NCGR_PEP_ID=MMETSP1180-20130426/2081_1 /TAXON_ID=3052 ORGANISM="Chlamydomonas cf sp, Strain CCMP681" /NCGR_SAMPLE_ID=MMETSP1180 /ASSEMBLY_ACC=CAM_ASM_000741 /LENGTH=439 /DNA_ID=CAMNT_0007088267 /DNA_START=47 /DNA_END=1366 /DNA_ORIENTATION=+